MIPQYEPSYGMEEADALYNYAISGGWFTEGKETTKFEEELSSLLGGCFTSMVNNGTISLALALLSSGIKTPSQKVIVPDITMIATANAVSFAGASPILVDIDRHTLCLDLDKAKEAIEKDLAIDGVLYVSLNGRSHTKKELVDFRAFCEDRGITFIEDAAQSLGSKFEDGSYIGTVGHLGSFSFSPHKIVSTGQGGCLITSDKGRWEDIERLKDFGRLTGGTDIHDHFGINSKFTDLQAVVGRTQLKKLKARIADKNRILSTYYTELQGMCKVGIMWTANYTVPWFVDVYVDDREELIAHLREHDIHTRPMYPALHTQKILEHCEVVGGELASFISKRGLWLPSSFNLDNDAIKRICTLIKDFYAR